MRKTWRIRVHMASAILGYIEIFYNRTRRHSQLAYATPIEHELRFIKHPSPPDPQTAAGNQVVGHVIDVN